MMKFLALIVLLSVFRAHSQSVDLFVGELNGDVYVEWSGNLTALYLEPLDDVTSSGTQQFEATSFLWAAFATPQYSYLTGSTLVDYNFVSPGTFSHIPDQALGDVIGLTGQTTIYIPRNYELRVGSPIEGCMLFEGTDFSLLGIADLITASVLWDDPLGEEPRQSITMSTNKTHFPPDHLTCFPTPEPSAAPSGPTVGPSPQPSKVPTTPPSKVPTTPPTQAPTAALAPTDAPGDDSGLWLLLAGIIAAVLSTVVGLILGITFASGDKVFPDTDGDDAEGERDRNLQSDGCFM